MELNAINFKDARIVIVGDVMLDRYWHGGTSRISPEAPVPIVHVNRVDERAGGAANVALGIAALGAKPHLLGLVGLDEAGNTLEKILISQGVSYQFDKVPDHDTITKLRVLSRNQQVIRLDTEKAFCKTLHATLPLKQNYLHALEDAHVVVLSDYGKGTLSNARELIDIARTRGIPTVVDPKSNDFSIYYGASVITPNLKEFEAVVGACPTTDILVEKAQALLKKYQIGALVITRSEHGVSVIQNDGHTVHIPAVAREVHDVTGAGDTVLAVLSVAMAAGMDLIKACTLGNIAAGIAVGKLGTATVTVQELEAALGAEDTLPIGVMDEESLLNVIELSKARGERIVFTNGCFDILHSGHVMYLEQARQQGDRVIVAVNDDASVARLKGPTRPINNVHDRMQVLAGLRSVDWVVSFSEDTPERIIRLISPDVMVKGGDYKDVEALPGAKFVLSQGGLVKLLGLKEGKSTTKIIEVINIQKEDLSSTAV